VKLTIARGERIASLLGRAMGCLLLWLATACASSARMSAEGPVAYFPPGAFASAGEDGAFQVDWYTKELRALREPSVLAGDRQAHAYRFLWLRTFDAPIALRVDVSPDGSGTLTVKRSSGTGGFEPGTLVTNVRRTLSRADVRRFLSLLETARFWELDTRERPDDEGGTITVKSDGAQWVMEGVRSGRYHVVDRWTPRSGAYREAALWLVSRAGLQIELSRIY
jgi:hypothetical protein